MSPYLGIENVDPEELAKQRALTNALWSQLMNHGVRGGDSGRIESVLYAPTRDAASGLAADLASPPGWVSSLEPTDAPDLPYRVTVLSPEVALSRAAFLELVEVMLIAASDHHCTFDGFQLALPEPESRPWWKLW